MTIKVIRPDILYNEYHPEHEEKDVVEPKTKTSEDVHGGNEITQSMQDQRFAQQQNDLLQCNNTQLDYSQSQNNNEQQTNDSNTQSEQQLVQQNDITQQQMDQNTSSQSDDKQTDQQNINDGTQQNEWDNETKQQNNDTQLDQQAEDQQNNNNQQLAQQNETTEDNNETNQQQTQEQQNDEPYNNNEQQTNDSNTQSEQQNDQGEAEDETKEQTLDDSVSDDYQEQEVEEQEYEEEEPDDYYEDVEEQEDTLQYNTDQAFKINGEQTTKRQLYLTFYRLIEYLSDEEKQPTMLLGQTLVLNVKKLMMRQYERKPLNAYYYYRTRSQVVLILDTSGSMEWLIDELDTFFKAALKRKDVQIYVAPNGHIEEYYDYKTKRFEPIYHDYATQQIIRSGLPVVYVGDFDGANTPIELSWNNRVYWICTETRYKYFSHHDWVGRCLEENEDGECKKFKHYYEDDFKGFFGRAFNDEEIITVLKEFSKNVYKQRFWYDNHDIEDFSEE